MLQRSPARHTSLGSRIGRRADALFVVLFLTLLLAPLAGRSLLGPLAALAGRPLKTRTSAENRTLAPAPAAPSSFAALIDWPHRADAFVADHFPLRSELIKAANQLRFALFHETSTEQTVFGPTGRLFLTSHSADQPFGLIRDVCGIGVGKAEVATALDAIVALRTILAERHAHAILAVIPSAPTIYRDELPAWLRERCRGPGTIERIMAELRSRPGGADGVAYALAPMLAAAATPLGAIAKYDFHWNGNGASASAEFLAGLLGRRRLLALPGKPTREASDLSTFMPGLRLVSDNLRPDYAATGIAHCWGPTCFPELDGAAKLVDTTRLGSPAGGKRLLLLGDSYAAAIAPWFARYYASVWHFSTNNLDRLSPAERGRFVETVFQAYAPDDVIMLYHDGNALAGIGRSTKLLFE